MYVLVFFLSYFLYFFLFLFFPPFFLPSFFLFLSSCFKNLSCRSYLHCCSPRNKLQNNACNTSEDIIGVMTMQWAGRVKDCAFISGCSKRFFVSPVCVSVLGSIPPFIKRVMGAVSLGVKRSGRKAHHSRQSCMCLHVMHMYNFSTSIRSRGSPVYRVRALISDRRYNKIPVDVCLPIPYGKVSYHKCTLSLDMKSLKQRSSINCINKYL